MVKEVTLTHEGLSRLSCHKNFELKTDSQEETIVCSKSQISFISPVISKLLLVDPTINEFTLHTKKSSTCAKYLRILLNGSSLSVKDELVDTFVGIVCELGNEELLSCINGKLNIDPSKREQTDWDCVTDDIEGGALLFDFNWMKVGVNGYMLKAHSSNFSSGEFMKSWKVEGSNDKETWEIIDEQKDSEVLLSNMAEGHWSFETSPFYRYVRLMMTDKNTSDSYRMALHGIDFYVSRFD